MAAGQIFFTLSVGMGTIHCYAAYIDAKDDIALNAVSTGFMNEFVEVVLGSLIVIPIAAGYLGLDWVIQNALNGFSNNAICLNNGVLFLAVVVCSVWTRSLQPLFNSCETLDV
jgi:SNF family Na+-dependent transporter